MSRDPSPRRTEVTRDVEGHPVRSAFYGGFVSRVVYRRNGREHEIFSQEKDGPCPFVLPDELDEPEPSSLFEFWGPGNCRVAFEIQDHNRQIDRIEVKLKGPGAGRSAGGVRAMQDEGALTDGGDGGNEETLLIWETPMICPPMCPPPKPPK